MDLQCLICKQLLQEEFESYIMHSAVSDCTSYVDNYRELKV